MAFDCVQSKSIMKETKGKKTHKFAECNRFVRDFDKSACMHQALQKSIKDDKQTLIMR